MSYISMRNLGKSYGKAEIFRGLNLDIEEGEFAVLVGPSGCGKSTLLRMIAGLEDISFGDLFIDGRRMNTVPAKRRDIAMVFQSYALYPHMTVAENMTFALRLARVSKAERGEKARAAADILGLSNYLERLPRELSGGQRQRVAMGRAIVRDPKAFLFDEPLSNLDAKLRHSMRGEIRRIHQRLGRTTVYVTHDQVEAMSMADRIVVLNEGRVEQIGSPRQLFDDPDNLFVAGFIGTPEINLLEGRIAAGELVLACALAVDLDLPTDLADETPVTCGIRPQHLNLGAGGVPGEIVLVEQIGDGQEVRVRLDGGQEVTVVTEDAADASQGDRVHVAARPGKALVFDVQTGNRIRGMRTAVRKSSTAAAG